MSFKKELLQTLEELETMGNRTKNKDFGAGINWAIGLIKYTYQLK